jgi:hypothetical protein
MQLDESISELAKKLDDWLDGVLPLLESNDSAAQSKALLDGVKILNQFDRLKEEGIAALNGLLNRQEVISQEERLASLVQGFAFAAKLWGTLGDQLPDIDAINDVARHMRDIVSLLDAIEPSRASLLVLLDHPNDMVRVSAGEYLIGSTPERVVPVLRAVDEKDDRSEATIRASLVLFAWEHEQKERSGPAT